MAEGQAALFILSPRIGETMITMAQAEDNARMIREGRARIEAVITAMPKQGPTTRSAGAGRGEPNNRRG